MSSETFRVRWHQHAPGRLDKHWEMVGEGLTLEQAQKLYREKVADPNCGGVVLQSESVPMDSVHVLRKTDPRHPLYEPETEPLPIGSVHPV